MSQGSSDDPSDRTVVRPRGAPPAAQPSAPAPAAWDAPRSAPAYAPEPQARAQYAPPPPRSPAPRHDAPPAPAATINEFLGSGLNVLVQLASPLLLLAAQLRNSVSQPDAGHLREQVINQVRQFETRAQAAGIVPQTITAARYALCTMLDESVLNTPWGEHSGWAAKTLLVVFHGEAWGGEKFFQILDRLTQDPARHIDLIELMYLCLALGFGGRYQIEAGGRARLSDIQEDLYRRIRSLRPPAAEELAPHWKGIEDRRNPLIRYVPLWVIAVAAAFIVIGAFIWFYSRLNTLSSPVSAQLASIGLDSAAPSDEPRMVSASRKSLKQLLAPEEAAGALTVTEEPSGRATVRLNAAEMFPSGGVTIGPSEVPLLNRITAALNQVPGRVIVIGHTDDQPLRSLRYKDNFELSSVRAKAVVDVLAQGLDNPARLDSSGAGSSRPIAVPADLPANRTRNRRVEIIYNPEG